MPRVARPLDLERISMLQSQIRDPDYITSAIDRLAGRITDHLLNFDEPGASMRQEDQVHLLANSSSMENAVSRVDRL